MPGRCNGVTVALTVLALLAVGCGDGGGNSAGGPTDGAVELSVVATTSVLGDVTGNVLGGVGQLHVLMPAGVDPHAYEPSAADARRVREADLVVSAGLGLEAGLLDVLEAAEAEGVVVLRLAEHLDPIAFDAHDHEHEEDDRDRADDERGSEGDDPAGALDPHVWFDPVRMADGVTLIADRLSQLAPWAAERVHANAEDHRDRILQLHEEIQDMIETIPADRRQLVTNHDSLGYLADRYGLEVIATIVPGGTTLGEASGRELAELVETVREADVRAIFLDTTAPDRLARTVSRELGDEVEVVELYADALGPPGSGADTYLGLVETDVRAIVDALTA